MDTRSIAICPRYAFTLIELSIVLVIIGLLVGGVLAGRSLIRSAELKSVLTDISKYDTAVAAFKERYFQYPGDISNATSFWTACLDDAPHSQTCNGNGNGKVELTSGNSENLRFWQHLALAGLITGSYNAINTGLLDYNSGSRAFSKDFTPQSRLPNAYFVPDQDLVSSYSGFLPTRSVNAQTYVMTFGFITDTLVNTGAVLSPIEAYGLDVKSDDGLPLKGSLQGNDGVDTDYNPITPSCINSTEYRANSDTISCSLFYLR